jgi:hypothetical protein
VTARRLAWSLWALTVILLITAVALPSAEPDEDVWSMVASFVFALSFATVGALVASRQSRNPLGWIMCGAGLAYAVGSVSVTYVESTLVGGDEDLLETIADWVSGWVWMLGVGPAATFLLLLFPTGSLPTERWRPVAWLAGGGLALVVCGIAADVDVAAGLGSFLLLLAALASVASLVFRFRRARSRERRQLKWLTYAATVVGLVLALIIVAESTTGVSDELSNTLVSVSIAALPVSMGIAILRHGLFDIDVVINRTLVYATLTAVLVAAYVGAVLLFQLALSPLTEESDLAIAGSTLAVAALVRPLRRQIQAIVDRRFYRRRYDAARTLEGFGARVRDQVELDALGAELRGVVAETMQPAHVSLWLRS